MTERIGKVEVDVVKRRRLGPAERRGRAPRRGLAASGLRSGRSEGGRTFEFHERCREGPGPMVIKIDRRMKFVGGGDGADSILRLGYAVAD